MKNTKRIKRWIPNISFMDATINIPLMIMVGLLFIINRGIVFGIEGGEIITLPIPKVPILGWLLIYLALERLLPPVIRKRLNLSAVLADMAKKLKQRIKGPDDVNARIKALEGKDK